VSRELPTGITRTAQGYRAFVWVPDPRRPNGRVKSKRWKADATLKEMSDWREDQRVQARKPVPATAAPPTITGFAADVADYLDAVSGMPSFADRARDMGEWVALFGEMPRDEITVAMIRSARDRWRREGPKRVLVKPSKTAKATWQSRPIPLSASAVNHRLRALENFFTIMNHGRDKANPVREVDECDEPPLSPKGQTFALGYEILAFMPDITAPKKGGTHEVGSLSRIRFETSLVTGLTARQLGHLKESDVDWSVPCFTPPSRLKGRRSRRQRARQQPKARPLMPAALPVLRKFFAMSANKPFSATSLGRSIRRAIRAANVARTRDRAPLIPETLTPYELTRHTFGTEVYRLTENLKVVQDLLGHADIRQAERYAFAAVQDHQVAAVGRLSKLARRAGRQKRGAKPYHRNLTKRKTLNKSSKRRRPPEP
jgi:integrase